MIRVSIIGSGSVAQKLVEAFQKAHSLGAEIDLVQIYSRQIDTVTHLLDLDKITNNYNALTEADLYIIAVSDDAIASVSSQLPFKNRLVTHTSGSVAMEDLDDSNRKAVFYPLQTFSKNRDINFREVPICLESQNQSDFELLEKVAKTISTSIYAIDTEQRKALHVAAVFVNNFVNHLYQVGNDICNQNEVPFEILKPLIQETANKILTLSPNQAQTGPAKRKDTQTINTHLSFLTNEHQKEIYKLLTKSIIDNGKKL